MSHLGIGEPRKAYRRLSRTISNRVPNYFLGLAIGATY
jgi:hypothetical protein